MNYKTLVRLINFLIGLANKIRLIQCKKNHECICVFCENEKCKNRGIKIDELI